MGTTNKAVSSLQFPASSTAWANGSMIAASLTTFMFSRKKKGRAARRGLWVVLLGPDGAGKSSVITGMGSGVAAGFSACATYHLRPLLFSNRRTEQPNCDPHGRPARGLMVTILKLLFLVAANWLGYLAVVRPRVGRGELVLFDRYFTDCTVDLARYRMPESCRRIVQLIARVVPKPDLYVVLDAPTNVLRGRKQEVTPAEVERQRTDYRRLAARLPNAVLVNAAQPLAAVVDKVVEYSIERHLACYHPVFEAA